MTDQWNQVDLNLSGRFIPPSLGDPEHICLPPVVPDLSVLTGIRAKAFTGVINGPVVPHAEAFAQDVAEATGITHISTYPGHDPDQQHGLDNFALKVQGDAVAEFALEHLAHYGIWYVIWRQRIYNPYVANYWRDMADRGDPTANHFDHVHISFLEAGEATPEDDFMATLSDDEKAELFDLLRYQNAVWTEWKEAVGILDPEGKGDWHRGRKELPRLLKEAAANKGDGAATVVGSYTVTGMLDLK